ncbi:hypothetical protein DFH27DRAFT_628255 [Peziza echinospora]|nr:hypothetical protein DFH27DRAFT_628255 [Peziza echinospora]
MAEDQYNAGSPPSSAASASLDFNFSVEALRRWIVALYVFLPPHELLVVIVAVNPEDASPFPGVEVDYMLPVTPEISAADLSTICFNSFPERNSDTVGDVEFHFRFRHTSGSVVLEENDLDEQEHDHDDSAYWYGFCLFRQQKDLSVKRHFRQKSLVLISQHNFASLFRHLVKTVALIDFDVSTTIVESACANIAMWNSPRIGHQELPFLGSLLNVHIPPHISFPLQGLASPPYPSKHDLTLEHTKEIFTSQPLGSWATFIPLLPSPAELYIIFEQAILCEPMVVLADEPNICSEFVSSILDFIRPIPYAGDFRPYLTLQSDFFTNVDDGLSSRNNYLIGVTNPFFLKRLLHTQGKTCNPAHVVYLAAEETRRNHQSRSFYPFMSSDIELPSGFMPNETKGYIGKDWRFIKKLEDYVKGNGMSAREISDLTRRHFSILSALFLAPLNRYLATLMRTTATTTASGSSHSSSHSSNSTSSPNHNHNNNNMEEYDYAPFSEPDFLASLAKYGCTVQFKGKTGFHRARHAEAFYRRFCRSRNFERWLEMRVRTRGECDRVRERGVGVGVGVGG